MLKFHLPLLAATAVLATAAGASAQQTWGGVPVAEWSDFESPLLTADMPIPDVARYLAEDEARGHRPLRYGALIETELDMQSAGTWDITEDGTSVWRLRISAPGAKSLALEFSAFELPIGGQMFVHSDDMTERMGSFTHRNHQSNGGFVFSPIAGDSLVLEYSQPAHVQGEAQITVSTVIYDYRDLFSLERGFTAASGDEGGGDGACLIDVNCPQGDGWDLQKRSVMRTLSGGALCSGALINNTDNDQTPYVLTADHCGQSSNTVFRFGYERPNCSSGTAPTGMQMSGCQVLTSTSTFDSRLLRLNNSVPNNYSPVYAGWSRGSGNSFGFAFSMGHPSGGPKKISIDQSGGQGSGSFWNMTWSDGTLEGGSSGGPVFDGNGRVRGPACCVNAFVCNGQTASYGRFDRFYTNNNLAQWLDPAGTDPTTTDALDPFGGTPPPSISQFQPQTLPAIVADGPATLTIQGSGFMDVTMVEIAGTPVDAADFDIISDTAISLRVSPQSSLGITEIKVTNSNGVSDADNISINANLTPVLDLVNSDPDSLFNATGLDVYMSSIPFDTFFLAGSLSNAPTSIPGIVDLDIGNNLVELLVLGTFTIDPGTGWTFVNIPLGAGLPAGTTLYLQGAALSGFFPSFPLSTSNVQSGTILL